MDPRMHRTEIKLDSHSNVVFLWPAWVAGYAVALASYLQGEQISVVPSHVDYIHPSNNPGLLFIDWKLRTIQELIAISPEQVVPPVPAPTAR